MGHVFGMLPFFTSELNCCLRESFIVQFLSLCSHFLHNNGGTLPPAGKNREQE